MSTNNKSEVPTRALNWISNHHNYLLYLQEKETPAMAMLALDELSDEYYSAFRRDLLTDLEAVFGKSAT
jgi:hypothetical protein